jgi:hypothetical protein
MITAKGLAPLNIQVNAALREDATIFRVLSCENLKPRYIITGVRNEGGPRAGRNLAWRE